MTVRATAHPCAACSAAACVLCKLHCGSGKQSRKPSNTKLSQQGISIDSCRKEKTHENNRIYLLKPLTAWKVLLEHVLQDPKAAHSRSSPVQQLVTSANTTIRLLLLLHANAAQLFVSYQKSRCRHVVLRAQRNMLLLLLSMASHPGPCCVAPTARDRCDAACVS